jgi:hypothetical protein
VLYLLDGVHHILDACFRLCLKKVDDGLEEVVNGMIKSGIEGRTDASVSDVSCSTAISESLHADTQIFLTKSISVDFD